MGNYREAIGHMEVRPDRWNKTMFFPSSYMVALRFLNIWKKKLEGNYIMLRAVLNKSWGQYPTKQQLYGHLPLITKTIKVRRTRHAGHCWKSKDKLISDVLLWTIWHGRAKVRRPARTYTQQLCADRGCNLEDLPGVMDNRDGWWERVREICTSSVTWYIYMCVCVCVWVCVFVCGGGVCFLLDITQLMLQKPLLGNVILLWQTNRNSLDISYKISIISLSLSLSLYIYIYTFSGTYWPKFEKYKSSVIFLNKTYSKSKLLKWSQYFTYDRQKGYTIDRKILVLSGFICFHSNFLHHKEKRTEKETTKKKGDITSLSFFS